MSSFAIPLLPSARDASASQQRSAIVARAMTRRKQHCPKRMKWEGGEGGEEGGEADGDSKNSGDESSSPGTPNSDSQPDADEEGRNSRPGSPVSPQPIPGEPIPLNLRESSSPRCPSRESRGSSIPPRCLSRDSAGSDQGANRLVPPPEMSPMGLAALSSGIPVNAAGGLLPPHPAAVAAYLGVVPPHRLVMTSPLPPVLTRSSVSPHVSSSSSPPMLPLAPVSGMSPPPPASSPMGSTDSAVLDFSTKRSKDETENESILNLSKPPTPGAVGEGNSPLDLSCGGRKRSHDDSSASSPSPSPQPSRKSSRSDYKSVVSPWTSPSIASHFPYFAAAAAVAAATQSLSPKNNNTDNPLWNGKLKLPEKSPSHYSNTSGDSSKALEKLNELSKLGGEDLFRSTLMPGNNIAGTAGRHSAWQSHWLNKGAEQAKDVLKCVWCKQSFPSLAAMTTHMKEAKHCGVNVPSSPLQPQTPTPPVQPAVSSPSSNNGPTPSSKQDLNLLIKETMPLPRKLVRGQDVWLGKGAEQTRQILKCMWCGQSFRSLAEMTSHMQQTQHYTNIISQEQIISWKSADDKQGSAGGGPPGPGTASGASSHVSAVLTCKVCDQAFSSLKELSNHMVKNSHYKEHIMRSISESGGRRRQTREKRKKSLPVRKLLELERAQNELKNGETGLNSKISRDFGVSSSRINCEKCGDKVETSKIVEHIHQCIGAGLISNNQRNLLKNALLSENAIPGFTSRDGRKSVEDNSGSKQHRSPSADMPSTPVSPKEGGTQESKGDSTSVLNAIEKLIEKSFDSRSRHGANFTGGMGSQNAPIGSSILKRLGIDESVDYTKPLVDAQTMNMLRSYHHSNYRRERSGSESSSMSERGARSETLTPDKKNEIPLLPTAQRATPDKRLVSPPSVKNSNHEESDDDKPLVKKEAPEEPEESEDRTKEIKKEAKEEEDGEEVVNGQRRDSEDDGRRSINSNHSAITSPKTEPAGAPSPSRSSPSTSERSGTPRSDKKSSLGALSSMFDNLSGGNGTNSGEASAASGKTTSSHPLAALQKLCDKTETHHPAAASRSSSTPNSTTTTQAHGTAPGAILAFSWACNDAVVTADSIMKCAFCDTPFISKGAYRHHLSKMHFVKDGVIPDTVALKAQTGSGKGSSSSRTVSSPNSASSSAKSPQPNFEESPHSKFLKYTELAKQLSSKYV